MSPSQQRQYVVKPGYEPGLAESAVLTLNWLLHTGSIMWIVFPTAGILLPFAIPQTSS